MPGLPQKKPPEGGTRKVEPASAGFFVPSPGIDARARRLDTFRTPSVHSRNGCAALPRDRPPMSPLATPFLDFERHTLDNGLRVVLHRNAALPLVAVNLWYHVGSKNERPGRTGFAHL